MYQKSVKKGIPNALWFVGNIVEKTTWEKEFLTQVFLCVGNTSDTRRPSWTVGRSYLPATYKCHSELEKHSWWTLDARFLEGVSHREYQHSWWYRQEKFLQFFNYYYYYDLCHFIFSFLIKKNQNNIVKPNDIY